MRRLALWTAVLGSVASCRYLAPPAYLPDDGQRPVLRANGGPADPTRAQPIPGRPCVVACGAGTVCDERLAACVPDPAREAPGRDAGPAWLP
jgi:hypothetical protein